MDLESPQLVDTSEGEISDFEQEGPDSGTPELDQLVPSAEEQLDFDSFPTSSVTRAPLWKFVEESSSGSQTQPQTQTATIQAQPITILRRSLQVLRYRLQLKLRRRLRLQLSLLG